MGGDVSGPRVGRPAPFPLVASFLVAGLVCFLLAALALFRAAPDLAHGFVADADPLLAVHLLALGFLPLTVAGAALHVLPTLLRASGDGRLGWAGLAGLCAGPVLAVAIARHRPELARPTAALVGLGALALLADVALIVARAPRNRMLLASRFGVAASGVHALLAFLLGTVLFEREWRPWLGIPHERLIAIHLHLAVLGWLTLLVVTVGRTLVPMLALSPSEPVRPWPREEVVLAAGLWLGVLGFVVGSRTLVAVGGVAVLASLARFASVLVGAVRRTRMEAMEGPVAHVAAGLLFLAEATVLAVLLLAHDVSLTRLSAYVLLLLLGWAAGITLGHAGKLLALSAWTWWPPGPRPKQAELYPRRTWIGEAAAFAVGVQLLAAAALSETPLLGRIGAAALVVSALLALVGAARTLGTSRSYRT